MILITRPRNRNQQGKQPPVCGLRRDVCRSGVEVGQPEMDQQEIDDAAAGNAKKRGEMLFFMISALKLFV